jgi:DNA-binding MarR family transcriptional regulator
MSETGTPTRDASWRASSVSEDLSFLLARSNALSLAAGNEALRPFGLRVRSYPVLALACDGLRPTQRELADFLRLDPSQVVSLIDELEGHGLVERQTDERDRRSKVLVPTAAGHRVFAEAREAVIAAEVAPFAALSPAERETLTGLLGRVAFPAPRGGD